MDNIRILYSNDFGIAFFWKLSYGLISKKVQLVFRDTRLELTIEELQNFSEQIKKSLHLPPLCSDCKLNKNCKSLLLQTPAPQISFTMSFHQLESVQDLVKGTQFQLELDRLLI